MRGWNQTHNRHAGHAAWRDILIGLVAFAALNLAPIAIGLLVAMRR